MAKIAVKFRRVEYMMKYQLNEEANIGPKTASILMTHLQQSPGRNISGMNKSSGFLLTLRQKDDDDIISDI
jgi:hypothetical protein